MISHAFGGDWTEDKLARLAKYLTAYRSIFTGNTRARHFTTWYVDAFAGTGSRSAPESESSQNSPGDAYDDAESARYRDGSAKIALGLKSPFDHYLFVEKSRNRINELGGLIQREFTGLAPRVELKQGGCKRSFVCVVQRARLGKGTSGSFSGSVWYAGRVEHHKSHWCNESRRSMVSVSLGCGSYAYTRWTD